jgi:hypothetical protein
MIKDDNQYLGIHAKSALLHIKVQQGFEFWLPYWMQIRHSTTPWIKTLDQMILDCKKQNLNEIVEEVVPKDPDFPAPVPSLVSKDVIYSYFY